MDFKEFIKDEALDESISSMGAFKLIGELLSRLEAGLDPKGLVARNVAKELGDGYKLDFRDMSNDLKKIIKNWEEIVKDASEND